MKHIEEKEPDIMILQEVGVCNYEQIQRKICAYDWFCTKAYQDWCVVIGIRRMVLASKVVGHHLINFGKKMGSGKAAVIVEFDTFIVAGVHLPFYKRGAPEAFAQIEKRMDVLDPDNKKTRFVVGDFNLDFNENLEKSYYKSVELLIKDSDWRYDKKELLVKTTKGGTGLVRHFNHLIYQETKSSNVEVLRVNPLWDATDNLKLSQFPSDHTMVEFVVCINSLTLGVPLGGVLLGGVLLGCVLLGCVLLGCVLLGDVLSKLA